MRREAIEAGANRRLGVVAVFCCNLPWQVA
jgi:hypothetical protein